MGLDRCLLGSMSGTLVLVARCYGHVELAQPHAAYAFAALGCCVLVVLLCVQPVSAGTCVSVTAAALLRDRYCTAVHCTAFTA
jgi:hypothetical protein